MSVATGKGLAPNSKGRPLTYAGVRALYVVDAGPGTIDILKNKGYRELGAILDGFAVDVSLDTRGNLYATNENVPNIAEYAPNATSPFFTYTAGMISPSVAAVDAHGNVFDGDYNGSSGYVSQYYQGVDSVLYSCTLPVSGTTVRGVAVDSSNDVFVTDGYNIYEYVGGLRGCNATTLGVSGTFAGISVDKSGNLVVCTEGGVVDVIDPPYTSVTRTIGSGFNYTVKVSLSKDNTHAFVTDTGNHAVVVVNYQTGANVTTLGGGNGLVSPFAAVDGPDAVY